MAVQNKVPVKAIYGLHGGPPIQLSLTEAANQTFLAGDPVYINASGDVALFTAALDTGGQKFVGFAAEAAHNNPVAAAVNVGVYIGWGNVFLGNVTSNGADQATVRNQVGEAGYPLYHDATAGATRAAIDIARTGGTITAAIVIKISDAQRNNAGGASVVGDTNGLVEFVLIPAALQITGGA